MEFKKELKLVPTELQEHLALMKWVSTQPKIRDYIIHIPNEGKRDSRYGNKLKRMGMRAGVSDFFLPIANKNVHGLWLELKRQKGSSLQPMQVKWLERMREKGYAAEVAYGWQDAKEIIENYLT